MSAPGGESLVSILSGRVQLEGILEMFPNSAGVVVFSHGSGSGRRSPRNRYVAQALQGAGLGTLLLDLLTPEEDQDYEMRFDIELLTTRLSDAVRFVRKHGATRSLPVGLFGASTGAASALRVAAAMLGDVKAVVSRGGRPDLAGRARAVAGRSADAPHRRRKGSRRYRAESRRIRAAALREAAQDRTRRDASVRGAGNPRRGRASRCGMVCAASFTRRRRAGWMTARAIEEM